VPNIPVSIGEVFADKYRVERILGEGGMGVVVAAHHLELDQPVAVKFLLDDVADHEEGAERFRREARAAAKIQSDHVVRVLDVGLTDGGVRFMVMEYLDGRDLAEEIAENGTFPIGAACGFILEALDAVGHAHKAGIVHRDLKPANLFLAKRPDGAQRIKVLDFGISKSVGATTTEQMSLTKTSAWIGSPLYMAPEQMQSARDVDTRADIWSLGAILYELIVGHPPYEADSLPQLCNLLMTTEPTHIKERCPTIPDDLAAVVMGCLVREVNGRIQTCADLARGISRYATTRTGSGMSHSLLARTEFSSDPALSMPGMSIPGASIPGASVPGVSPSSGAPGTLESAGIEAPSGLTQPSGSPVGTTHSSWGGTDSGEKKSGNRLPMILAAVAIAGVGGYFLATNQSAPEEVAAEEMIVGAADPDSAESEVIPVEEPKEAPEPKEEPAPEKSLGAEEPATDVAPKPAPKAQPVVKPSPQPVRRPKPRPAPQPAPEPTPSAKDDFADFGGRR